MLAPMDWPRLDTSSWNLSLGVVGTSLLAACGPFVIIPEGETDSESVTDTDPRPTTDPSETDTTPNVECQGASDCEPGYQCIGNVCMPDEYYCNDGGCCYGGTGGCCYDECCYGECYYNECYSDQDCGPQGLCLSEYGYACVFPYELPECGVAPAVVPLELPVVGEGEVVSLSFVELDGDAAADIVVGRNGTTELHPGGGAMPSLLPLPVAAAVTDAVSGDFDGDGDADLAVATLQGSVFVLASNGAGGFAFGFELPLGGPAYDLVALQWNGDGALDLAFRQPGGSALLLLNDGTGWLGSSIALPFDVSSMAAIDFGDPQYGAFLLQNGSNAEAYLGDFNGDTNPDAYLPGTSHGTRQLVTGRIDGALPEEAIGYTRMSDWLLLELWANGLEGPQRYSLWGEDTLAAMGDFTGEGVADLITAGGSVISYVRGYADSGYPMLECKSTYFNGGFALTMAVGDYDGNGRADVVIESGSGPFVLLTQ